MLNSGAHVFDRPSKLLPNDDVPLESSPGVVVHSFVRLTPTLLLESPFVPPAVGHPERKPSNQHLNFQAVSLRGFLLSSELSLKGPLLTVLFQGSTC